MKEALFFALGLSVIGLVIGGIVTLVRMKEDFDGLTLGEIFTRSGTEKQ